MKKRIISLSVVAVLFVLCFTTVCFAVQAPAFLPEGAKVVRHTTLSAAPKMVPGTLAPAGSDTDVNVEFYSYVIDGKYAIAFYGDANFQPAGEVEVRVNGSQDPVFTVTPIWMSVNGKNAKAVLPRINVTNPKTANFWGEIVAQEAGTFSLDITVWADYNISYTIHYIEEVASVYAFLNDIREKESDVKIRYSITPLFGFDMSTAKVADIFIGGNLGKSFDKVAIKTITPEECDSRYECVDTYVTAWVTLTPAQYRRVKQKDDVFTSFFLRPAKAWTVSDIYYW